MRNKSCISIALLIVTFFLGAENLLAQRGNSFTFGSGVSYYYGDLTDDFNNHFIRPNVQLAYTRYFTDQTSLRLGFMHTMIGASDSLAKDPGRVRRGIHFRNPVTELSGLLYYEFASDGTFGIRWRRKPHFSPYVFAGLGIFYHSPKAQFQGQWVPLRAAGTEGQYLLDDKYGKPYGLIQIAIPFGAGISMRFSQRMSINMDVSYRKTFTDYLDDTSGSYPDLGQLAEVRGPIAAHLSDPSGLGLQGKRGNPGAKDSYIIASISFSYFWEKW